jgi:hypothetical protein
MRQTMNSRKTAAHAEATQAQAHTIPRHHGSVPLFARSMQKRGYACACACTWECGGSCGYVMDACDELLCFSLHTPTPSERSAAAALAGYGTQAESSTTLSPPHNLSGLRKVRFLRAHKHKTPAGVAQRHACHSSVSAQRRRHGLSLRLRRAAARPPHARRRARGRDKHRHARPPRFARTWRCHRRRGRVPARPHSTVHRR